jgi:HK97 gp10 family phage protein
MELIVNTSNYKHLEDFFQELSAMDQRKIFISAYRKAVKPLVALAKSNVPVKTGNLRRSIGTIEIPDKIAILVGAKTSGKYKGWYAHFLEPTEGNNPKERFRRRMNGKRIKTGTGSTGKMTIHRFFEPAYDATEEQIFSTIEQEWYRAIDEKIIRVNKIMK